MTREQAWRYLNKYRPDNAPIEWQKAYYIVLEKGKWEKHRTRNGNRWYRCNSCQWVTPKKTNYCPNCGADCRERNDND